MSQRFAQALAYLLPPGAAWPRDPSSVWMRVIFGLAAALDELHHFTHQAVEQWQPHSTSTRLAEWEEATGLPDACFGAAQTVEQRQARLLARLRGFQGAYPDSSPAALAGLVAFAAALGWTVSATHNTPFRVGMHRVGRRLGRNGVVVIEVPAARAAEAAELTCALERVMPARFALTLAFV